MNLDMRVEWEQLQQSLAQELPFPIDVNNSIGFEELPEVLAALQASCLKFLAQTSFAQEVLQTFQGLKELWHEIKRLRTRMQCVEKDM